MKLNINDEELREILCEHMAKIIPGTDIDPSAIEFSTMKSPTRINAEVDLSAPKERQVPAGPTKRKAKSQPKEVTEEAEISPPVQAEVPEPVADAAPAPAAINFSKDDADSAKPADKSLFG